MTIRDLIEQVELEGPVQIKRICGDDIDVMFDTDDIRYFSFGKSNNIESFLDKEITYMYVNSIPTLCIEYRED